MKKSFVLKVWCNISAGGGEYSSQALLSVDLDVVFSRGNMEVRVGEMDEVENEPGGFGGAYITPQYTVLEEVKEGK